MADDTKRARPVAAQQYSSDYFLGSCGGTEFFDRYGPKVLKPTLAYCLSKADLRPGLSVLDIGCGRGELLYHVKQAGAAGTGTDYSGAALKIGGEVSGCPMVQCDAKSLPFPDRSFDRVFLIGIMDHLHRWELEACFKELGRVLKPGGFVVIHTCTNRLYYKTWTYRFRLVLAKILRLPEPKPPRTSDDLAMHVNEHDYPKLRAFFRSITWQAEIEPRPNCKLMLGQLYGEPLPADFPLKPSPRWKAFLYLGLLWWPPLNWILAREFFCLARPGAPE